MEWPLLAGLREEDARAVLAAARRRTFARGEVVFHRGDPADSLHLIRKGRFAVRIVTPLGDQAILAVLPPGAFFGELALLSGDATRSATIAALEPGETLSLHRHDFDRLRRASPSVGEVVEAALVMAVRRLSEQLVEALYVPAEKRVVRRLRDVVHLYERAEQNTEVPLTQEEIAELAGTSRATVNRVLRGLQTRGVVDLRRGRTVVLDASGLRAAAR